MEIHAVITSKYKHITAYYLQFCQDNNYESLSESSLYRILKELKPSQWKSLAGLDNTIADGLNGFSILADIAKKYFPGNKGIVDNTWKGGKQYLKIGYLPPLPPLHYVDHSTCASHCISFALSIQIYSRRDNAVLKITIFFVINTAIYIKP